MGIENQPSNNLEIRSILQECMLPLLFSVYAKKIFTKTLHEVAMDVKIFIGFLY